MKKSKPQQALLCHSIKRSHGMAGALIMRQQQEGKGGCGGGRGGGGITHIRAHELMKRHSHTGARTNSASVRACYT